MPELIERQAPPHNREAEIAVLGSMLAEKESMLRAMDMLREEDFYDAALREVFAAVRDLHDKNVTPDVITLGDYLQKKERLQAVGGQSPFEGREGRARLGAQPLHGGRRLARSRSGKDEGGRHGRRQGAHDGQAHAFFSARIPIPGRSGSTHLPSFRVAPKKGSSRASRFPSRSA